MPSTERSGPSNVSMTLTCSVRETRVQAATRLATLTTHTTEAPPEASSTCNHRGKANKQTQVKYMAQKQSAIALMTRVDNGTVLPGKKYVIKFNKEKKQY